MMEKSYIDTVRLLLESAPALFQTPAFALKGGTAINLFVDDMPRLSVDLDLVFTDYKLQRAEALKEIAAGLEAALNRLTLLGLDAELASTQNGDESKLFVRRDRLQIKVEVNHVFRGTVLPVEKQPLAPQARDMFTTELTVPILSTAELYASKMVAAMDRQHPRDFFDIYRLNQRDGITPELVECFVCYLAGHNRPIHEVLFSRDQDMSMAYKNDFIGMTRDPISMEELESTRRQLKNDLPNRLTPRHRKFLISLVSCDPQWQLMQCSHMPELPAIQWKLKNLAKLKKSNPKKFASQAEELLKRFKM